MNEQPTTHDVPLPDNFYVVLCERCARNIAVKAGPDGRPTCHTCARGFSGRVVGKAVLTGRNEPCPCGSGRKYKNCHRIPRTGSVLATWAQKE